MMTIIKRSFTDTEGEYCRLSISTISRYHYCLYVGFISGLFGIGGGALLSSSDDAFICFPGTHCCCNFNVYRYFYLQL